MLVNCNNKGCFSETEALLNKDTKQVFCLKCNKEVTNLTPFIKRALQDIGQVVKDNKYVPNGTPCPKCRKTTKPILKNNKYHCEFCNATLNFSPIYERFLKEKGAE